MSLYLDRWSALYTIRPHHQTSGALTCEFFLNSHVCSVNHMDIIHGNGNIRNFSFQTGEVAVNRTLNSCIIK